MRYQLLGNTGLRVSELCLGTMTFGEDWGWGSSEQESQRIFDGFLEAGGNFIDTANYYTKGTSEEWLGRFIQPYRDRIVLATKYTLSTDPEDPNAGGNQRKNMMQSVEKSLARLNTDYIDLYWLHIWDQITPVQEVLRGLDDLIRSGKVLYIGISDAPAWWIAQANTLAVERKWTPFAAMQLEYSLIERSIEREYFGLANALDLSMTAWSPLGYGVLTGKYINEIPKETRLQDSSRRSAILSEHNTAIAKEVVRIAEELGKSPAQVALAWVRQQHPRIIPIIGARTREQLDDNLGCLELTLNEAQMEALDQVAAIDLGFPHTFYQREAIEKVVFGSMRSKIDVPPSRQ